MPNFHTFKTINEGNVVVNMDNVNYVKFEENDESYAILVYTSSLNVLVLRTDNKTLFNSWKIKFTK